MSDVVSFREIKASKERDPRQWTPLDCLRAIIRDLESGEVAPVDGVYIAMVRKDAKGNAEALPYYAAGLTCLETHGMLLQHVLNPTQV